MAVTVSPNGGTVSTVRSSGLAASACNTSTGALTYLGVHRDGKAGVTLGIKIYPALFMSLPPHGTMRRAARGLSRVHRGLVVREVLPQ